MGKFESGVKTIPYSQESVYNKLSNLSHLDAVKDRIPQDKVQDVSFDENSVSFSVAPVGKVTLEIVEREPHKCIKFEATTSPVPFKVWVQLVPLTENECKMRLTTEVDVNPMMRMMIEKPLKDGLEKMADMLSAIPY